MANHKPSLLFLQCRNLGDAIISTSVINSLGKSEIYSVIDVFTRPTFKRIFENNPFVGNVYYSHFPMGTKKDFFFRDGLRLWKEVKLIRNMGYDRCLNIVGDFRENILGRLCSPQENITIEWAPGHPFRSLIRTGANEFIDSSIKIPADIFNIYDCMDIISSALGNGNLEGSRIYLDDWGTTKEKSHGLIGIHPIASVPCKMWPIKKWLALINELNDSGWGIWIFGAAEEREFLENTLSEVLKEGINSLHTNNLDDFFIRLSQVDLLIGLDSFSVHAAHACGVPSIMICGPSDYRIWHPPTAVVVTGKEKCPHYPCHSKPKCNQIDSEFPCMTSIRIKDILSAVETILKDENLIKSS